jgi:hypothetical protein
MLILLLILLIKIINNISNSRLRIYCLIYTPPPFPPFVCRPSWGLGLEMYRRFATYIGKEEKDLSSSPPFRVHTPYPSLWVDNDGMVFLKIRDP